MLISLGEVLNDFAPYFGTCYSERNIRHMRLIKSTWSPKKIEISSIFLGDARHRRLVNAYVCSVESECGFVKIHSNLRAKNSVKSPYFSKLDLVPALA